MKKQVLALSCALALGTGAAAWSPAGVQGVEPAGQIGYGLAKAMSANGAGEAALVGGLGGVGGKAGEVAARTRATVTVIRGMSARTMIAVSFRIGASVGLVGGFAGVLIGGAIGAL